MRHEPEVRSDAVTHPAGTVVPPRPPVRTSARPGSSPAGLGVARWRRRARLAAALESLARGDPPTRVVTEVGYATASAFGAMVKAELGGPPGTLT